MVTVYRVPQSTTTQVITPACMVWTPAPSPVPAVYATGVMPGSLHGVAALAAPATAISTQLHGPVVTSTTLLSQAPVATPVATPVQAFRSPRKTQPQQLTETPSTPNGGLSGGACAEHGSTVGGSVSVGSRRFERLRELGKGSFGVVWEVQEAGDARGSSGPLALKCSKPANQQMLEACLFEAEVLQKLAAALPEEVALDDRVPRYVAHCMTTTAASASPTGSLSGAAVTSLTGQSQVLVAMSKLEGKPLDQWLYGVDENKLKTVPLTQVMEGPFPEGVFSSFSLSAACATTSTLLEQMAPIFASLDGIAYHRDVSAHNFLLRDEVGDQHFALLDFGLAVRAPSWQREYQSRNISGDPRYFTPAAMMLMVYGHKYLEAHPDSSFLEQYKHRMDYYSMGLLSLEVLFCLWRGPEAETECLEGSEDEVAAATARLSALARVRGAWQALWKDAFTFFQLFHSKGFAPTREALARSQGVSKYVDKLRTLCSELRSAAAEVAADAAVTSVLEIALGLLDPRGTLCWRDIPGHLCKEASQAKAEQEEPPREVPPAGEAAGEGEAADAAAAPEPPASERPPGSDVQAEETQLEPPPLRPVRKFTHRRNWTVDEAVSLTRGVREVGMGWGAMPTMPEEKGS